MLYLHQSNKTEQLKNWLLEILLQEPACNPFRDEQILVQNPGMAQWLQHQIAVCSGIAAGIKFPLPSTFIWQLFKHLLPDVPDVSAFSKEAMTWKLMHLLPDNLKQAEYAALEHYLMHIPQNKDEDHLQEKIAEPDQLKIYQLATKIADTFDQYLVYRPDWIKAWEKGDMLRSVSAEQQWQPLLWQKLTQYTQTLKQSHWHRGCLYEALIEILQKKAIHAESFVPDRLFIFGISTLPESHIQVFQALGQQIDVHIMVHNPSQFYWGNVSSQHYHLQTQDDLQFSADFVNEEANSLLASMGKLGRDYHDLLSDIQAQEDDRFIDPITTENKTLAVPPSLLQQIQSHIFNLTEPNEAVTLPPEDDSVTINSCHSVLREVEIVHDYLLSVLEKNPDLTPKDIIVMTPDVETYSAPIQAVFSGASAQRFIPFAISDRNARREHPLLETLLKLLSCDQTRCTITDVMTILEVPAVMRRYNIQPEQLAVLHQWIAESGIRWGLDCYHKQQLGLPEQLQNTWEFGLQRLLLGYAFKGQDILYDEILPVEDIEGSDAVLSGALADFITDLTQLSRSLQKARTAEQWMLLICLVLETFFLADEKEKPVLQIVRNLLTDFCEQIENAGFKYPVAHAVMLEWLTDHLDSHKMSQRFLGGKVNVCTLMPMRSIPFKVICILGMNDGDYPRTIAPGSFDLISKFPRKGDRSRRDDDRYLFLEALLAAESYLYISYTGRNIKDNTERPPSVLLSEFLDYCQRHFNPDGQKQWVTEHPLQPFSPEYFDKRSSLFTYAAQWLVPATTTLTGEASSFIKDLSLPVLPLPEQTELEQLMTFYRHPCKYFFQQRLSIHFEKLETLPKDDEPFDFTGLDNFHLQSILLDHQLRDVPSEHSIQILKASGKLPHPPFDKIKLEQIRKSLQPWAEEIKSLVTDPQEAQKVCLTVGSTRITGWIKDIYNHRLIRYHPGKVKSKLLVSGLIEHLIWCAGGKHLEETVLFYLPATAKEQSCIRLPRFSQQFSLAALEKLVHGYQRGLNEPLPFIPEVSTTWILSAKDYILQSADRGDVPQRAVQKTKEAFEREQSRDDYIARVWSEMDEKLFSDVTSIAETLLQPLIISDNKG